VGKIFQKGGDDMPVDFFVKEVDQAQRKFNQTFGMLETGDIKLRQSAILKICGLGCLRNKIVKAANRDQVRDEICNFMKIRNTLNNVFNTIETYQKERRHLQNDQRKSKQKDNCLRRGKNLPELRQYVPAGMAQTKP
jgi:hypothetical protein